MYQSGIRKKRKFVLYRSQVFGDITIVDLLVMLLIIAFSIVAGFFINPIWGKVTIIALLWTIYFWFIWESGDYKGYELLILWISFLFRPKNSKINFFSDEEEKFVVFKVSNGLNLDLLSESKQVEIIAEFTSFLNINDFPLKIVKVNEKFPLEENNNFLSKVRENEEILNKDLVIENYLNINSNINENQIDSALYLYFKISNDSQIKEIKDNLIFLKNANINFEQVDLSKEHLYSKILNYATEVKEKSNGLELKFKGKTFAQANISKINFNGDIDKYWLSDLLNSPYTNFVVSIEKTYQPEAIKTYEKYIRASKNNLEETRKLKDEIKSDQEYHSNREVLEEVILGRDILIKTDLNIITYNKDFKLYKKILKDMKNILKLKSIKLTSSWYLQTNELSKTLSFSDSEKYYLMPLSTLSVSFPFTNFNFIDEKGFLLGFQNTYKPFVYNPLNLKGRSNFINLVVGKTGSGKTTLIKLIALTLITLSKSKTIILDPHNEYSRFLDFFEGEKINFNSSTIINPLAIIEWPKDKEQVNETINQRVFLVSKFIEILFKDNITIVNNSLSQLKVLLKQFYLSHYDNFLKNYDFNQLDLIPIPTFSMLNEFIKNENVRNDILHHFTEGIYNTFNSSKNLKFDSELVIFNLIDLLKISDINLRRAHYFLITTYLNDLMYLNHEKDKFLSIIIDEAHLILSDYETLSVISKMTREARKFKTMILLGSQNLSDFRTTSNETLSSIFSNSSNIFIGKIESDQIAILNSLLETKLEKLSPEEIAHFQQARGSFLYLNEQHRVRLQVTIDDFIEHIIFNETQIQKSEEY